MLFHSIEESEKATGPVSQVPGLAGIEQAVGKKKVRTEKVRPGMVLWATGVIIFFVVAAFVAHHIKFQSGETVFLNLTVVLASASVGTFLGEKLALNKLLL